MGGPFYSLATCLLIGGFSSAVADTRDGSIFIDNSVASGLQFTHFNGMVGKYYYTEMVGSGGGFIDYDNDGDLDVYLVQSAMLSTNDGPGDLVFPLPEAEPRDRLFRNMLVENGNGPGALKFEDVTEKSGIHLTGYGMGVTVGDYNNDGWSDLYVTHFGKNRMLKNNGDGTFSDVTDETGTGDPGWGSSAAFFDYDRDGWLDLYITNYVDYSLAGDKRCYAKSSRRDYCGPSSYPPTHDRLYHNLGNGRFVEVSDKLLRDYKNGPGLGVVTADFNGDGWIDIYVTNDGAANQLWLNQKGKGFIEDALFSGTAVNMEGRPEASMGVDAGDFDNDGDPDLFITHLMGETNTLYINQGQGMFEDRTGPLGLAAESFPYTTFGVGWIDYDNDGWLDLLTLNGAVRILEPQVEAGDPYPLHQPNQLFRNQNGRIFKEVDYHKDSPLRHSEVSRGAAFGDVDNDGDTDVLIFNNSGPVRLLLNQKGQEHPWFGLRLTGEREKRDLLGAEIFLLEREKPIQWKRVHTDGSYCAANDPRVLFAYPPKPEKLKLLIRWPDGSEQTGAIPPAGKYTLIQQPEAKD